MASTSVHLPAPIVEKLDRLAAERHTSRNRVILLACEAYLGEHQADWPESYFSASLSAEDLEELRSAGQEMESTILAARRDRGVPPL